MIPGYVSLYQSGELERRVKECKSIYHECTLCPHECRVDRTSGQTGRCGQAARLVVASVNAHFGEEPPISGSGGSGTVFLSGCTGSCLFCQNYPISQLGTGRGMSDEELAKSLLQLQKRGCHNINFVTPTHFIPSIVNAVFLAAGKGLTLPIVYNTSGYERVEILEKLNGIVDIYLPDIKYADDDIAVSVSGFPRYTSNNRAALIEMYRQVGCLSVNNDGIAERGMVVRHLVLPNEMSGTEDCLRFLSGTISTKLHISLMGQYFPAHKAIDHGRLGRRLTAGEYQRAIAIFESFDLHNGWIQELNVV